ncbi:PrsW family intramembrane metalloprotease, partial [Candidatus Cyanaurora vandensis]|uniref:PrsW family intramembrane metalloprotease n=2 Tax=Candidatus Cyanaurora vandensis TaxID=2714958 RepID=UPI002581045E
MTTTLLLVLSAVAPALVLLAVVASAQRKWVRSPLVIFWAVVAGVVSAYLALAGETALAVTPWTVPNLGGLALFTLFGVGLVEEGAKYIVLRGLLWRLPSFREPYDGVLFATAVGLGFGATENISYVLAMGFDVALIRAFTAVPFHGMLGIILGYSVGRAKALELIDGRTRWDLLLGGLAWAVLGHGFYDFLAFQSNPLAEALLWGCLVGLAILSWRLARTAQQLSVSWGGRGPEPVQVFIPPMAPARNPVLAALLGLFPGAGQMYNGEGQKGWSLLGVALINLFSLGAVWTLLTYPVETILQLLSWNISLGSDPAKPLEFVASLAETPVLWVLGAMLVVFSLFGSWDAYRTAFSRRYEYLLAPPFRVKFVQSVALAYSGHLLLVLLVALVPLFVGSSAGGGAPLEFDLVEAPTILNGHRETPEGTPQGQSTKNQKEKIAQAPA